MGGFSSSDYDYKGYGDIFSKININSSSTYVSSNSLSVDKTDASSVDTETVDLGSTKKMSTAASTEPPTVSPTTNPSEAPTETPSEPMNTSSSAEPTESPTKPSTDTNTSNGEKYYFERDFLDSYFLRFADVNNDGKVDKKDIQKIQKALTKNNGEKYDVDGDGDFSIKDASIIELYLKGTSITGDMLSYETNKNIDILIEENSDNSSYEDIKKTLKDMTQEELKQYREEMDKYYDDQIALYEANLNQLESIYINSRIGVPPSCSDYVEDMNDYGYDKTGQEWEENTADREYFENQMSQLRTAIEELKKQKRNCNYLSVQFLTDYNKYKYADILISNLRDVVGSSGQSHQGHDGRGDYFTAEFDYDDYINKHKGEAHLLTPFQYYEACKLMIHPTSNQVQNVKITVPNQKEIEEQYNKKYPSEYQQIFDAMDEIKYKQPDYYKMYCYYYEQDPNLALQYVKDMGDDIIRVSGQYRAKSRLSSLGVKDGYNDEIEAIGNNFNIGTQGVLNGMKKFIDGGVYSFEALCAIFTGKGTTQMSADEYADMYFLYALMSQNNKEKMGLIKKNDKTGEYENVSEDFIIDFTKEYSGLFLDTKYQIAQGVGSALPSVAISFINPMAGSIAMGISAGGNAYHNSMINGYDCITSVFYGIFTGVSTAFLERKIGGLLGLSNTQVTSLKTYLISIGKETAMGQVSGLLDDVYRGSFMGDGFPTTKEGWEEYFERKEMMAIQSAATAGIMNFPALCTSVYKKRNINNQLLDLGYSKDDIKSLVDEFRKSHPEYAKLSDTDIKVRYGTELIHTTYAAAIADIPEAERQAYWNKHFGNSDTPNIRSASVDVTDAESAKNAFNEYQDFIDAELKKDNPDLRVVAEYQSRKNDLNHKYHLEEIYELQSAEKGATKRFASEAEPKTPEIAEQISEFRNAKRTPRRVKVGDKYFVTDLTDAELVKFANDNFELKITSIDDYPVGYGVPKSSDYIKISPSDGKMTVVWGENDGALYGANTPNAQLKKGNYIARVGNANGINVCMYENSADVDYSNTSSRRGLPWAEGSATNTTWSVEKDITVSSIVADLQKLQTTDPDLYSKIMGDISWDLYRETKDATLDDVKCLTGIIAPDFGGVGLDSQYTLPIRTAHLEALGYLKRV